jgi:DNA-binding NarL/FixJ family response regulator
MVIRLGLRKAGELVMECAVIVMLSGDSHQCSASCAQLNRSLLALLATGVPLLGSFDCESRCASPSMLHGAIPEPAAPTCLVVAEHQLCGQAVGGLLSEQCGLELVAVCASVPEALALMAQGATPALLLLDGYRATEGWQEAATTLRRLNPDGRLIMLTARSAELQPPQEIAPILLGVVEKSKPWMNLVTLVSRWQQQHPSSSVRRIATAVERLDHLSPRESRVFQCLGKGMHNKEIAAVLGLCVNTVETYRKVISAKLSLSGSELVRAAALHRCTHVADLAPCTAASVAESVT